MAVEATAAGPVQPSTGSPCSSSPQACPSPQRPLEQPLETVPHAEKAWQFFRAMGSPKFHVAPMVDQSELPFRMLCRNYGATCAYTPMMHARLFCEDPHYRAEHFTTIPQDRPLLVQFCANDPTHLVKAAQLAAPHVDGIDLNLGCPQRIARRGYYGAFLMDNLPLVERLVSELVQGVNVPVTVKIRVFPQVAATIAYAKMVERAGASVLAVHGRTRDQKDLTATRADWAQIKAVKEALSIPVLGNGNIQCLQDALDLMAATGVDGVLSAEGLLADPALFSPARTLPGGEHTPRDGVAMCLEYLRLCQDMPVHMRMVKGHVHRMVGPWLAEHVDLRDRINAGHLDILGNLEAVEELAVRVRASGRTHPIPAITPRQAERMAREAARLMAIEEQEREEAALQALDTSAKGTATPSRPINQDVAQQGTSGTSAPTHPTDSNGQPQGSGTAAQGGPMADRVEDRQSAPQSSHGEAVHGSAGGASPGFQADGGALGPGPDGKDPLAVAACEDCY